MTFSMLIILILLILLIVFYSVVKEFYRALNCDKWNQVPGKIIVSELIDLGVNSSKQDYRASIKYSYDYLGVSYESERITYYPALRKNDSVLAINQYDQYSVDKTVMVYVDPNNPKNSVLETKVTGAGYFSLAGVSLLIFCLLLALFDELGI